VDRRGEGEVRMVEGRRRGMWEEGRGRGKLLAPMARRSLAMLAIPTSTHSLKEG